MNDNVEVCSHNDANAISSKLCRTYVCRTDQIKIHLAILTVIHLPHVEMNYLPESIR